MGAAIIIIAAQNPNLDPSNSETLKLLQQRFKPELDKLFNFADEIAEALEDEKGWDENQHVSNVVTVLRAIWLNTTNRWKEAKLPQIVTGLREVQTMQDSGEFDENVIKDAATINEIKDLIGAQATEFEETEIKSIQRLSDFVSSIDPSNMKPSLENLDTFIDTFKQLINIALDVSEILEKHKDWNRDRLSDNLIAIVKAIGYIIYNQQLEETRAQPEDDTSAEPERNYQEAIEVLEGIFGAYEIKFPGKAKIDRAEIDRAEIIAFGDAHANPMQVIYQMLHTGIGYMPPDKLRELAEIYERIDRATSTFVTNETIQKMKEQGISLEVHIDPYDILGRARDLINKHFKYTGGSKTFVHLGDTFGDRGPCDHFMLALLKKIKAQAEQAGGKFVILASNHGTFLEDLGYEKPDTDYYDQTRSARVSAKLDPNYIEKLGDFLAKNTQLFYFDERTNTFFTHCPITRENLKDFVERANEVIKNSGKYGLNFSQFNFKQLEIPQNDDPKEISQFVENANQYYKAVMSWFFDFKDLSQSPDFEESNNKRYLVVPVESFFNYLSQSLDFEEFNKKRYLPPVESLKAVVGTGIRFCYNIDSNLAKPFDVTMVHGHDGRGNYSKVNDVYDLNSEAGKLPAYRDVGYSPHKVFVEDLYIYTNSAKSAKIHQN